MDRQCYSSFPKLRIHCWISMRRVQGESYFECWQGYGVFIRPGKVKIRDLPEEINFDETRSEFGQYSDKHGTQLILRGQWSGKDRQSELPDTHPTSSSSMIHCNPSRRNRPPPPGRIRERYALHLGCNANLILKDGENMAHYSLSHPVTTLTFGRIWIYLTRIIHSRCKGQGSSGFGGRSFSPCCSITTVCI